MKWLSVTIPVDDELSEPVSDILRRYAPDGVILESTGIIDNEGSGVPEDIYNLKAYIPFSEQIKEVKQRLLTDLWHLSQICPIAEPVFEPIEQQDWNALWKEQYHPIPVGKKLLIQPAWLPLQDTDRKVMLIDPGMAFGTGTHPTTRLCILAMEDLLQPGQSVIDLGCGTGILSIAAVLLESGKVIGFDNDPEAVAAARENIRKNGLAKKIETRVGSLEEVQQISRGFPPDLIVANILAHILIRMLDQGLADTLGSSSHLILSGILDHQLETVLEHAEKQGLVECQRYQERDWLAVTLRKKEETAS
ncbi:MAG: 50S ribosomal protein L11 methyltransferase [Anaerolineales bacterium]|nr:50S ribosomal protein L11 methyltransferase [Anaerolineales bacterium]